MLQLDASIPQGRGLSVGIRASAAASLSLVRDHRFAMVGAGLTPSSFRSSCSATLSMSFQPPLDLDFSRVADRHAAGHDARADRGGRRARRAIIETATRGRPRRSSASSSAAASLNIVAQEGPQASPRSSSSAASRPSCRRSPTRGSISIAARAAAGRRRRRARHHALSSAATIPSCCIATANKIVDEMATLPEAARAARRGRPASGPKSSIKPRFDLAADLGVTTAALSQTIRIATLGDIDQNSAKFSLPTARCRSASRCRKRRAATWRRSRTCRCRPSSGGSVPLKSVAEIGFGAGPDDGPAHQPDAPHRGRRRPRAGPGHGRRVDEDQRSCRR